MKKANAKDYLGKDVLIEINRQLGTKHPHHEFMYMLNYGFIPNTISDDGEKLDTYLVGVFEPVENFEGHVIAVIYRTNDDDDKLVVAPKDVEYSDDAIRAMTEFQEKFFESIILDKDIMFCHSIFFTFFLFIFKLIMYKIIYI